MEFPAGSVGQADDGRPGAAGAGAYGQEREPERYDPLVPVDQEWLGGLACCAVAKEQGDAPALPTKMWSWPPPPRFLRAGARSCRWTTSPSASFTMTAAGMRCATVASTAAGRWQQGRWWATPSPVPGTVSSSTCARPKTWPADPLAELDHYPVTIVDGQVHLQVPDALAVGRPPCTLPAPAAPAAARAPLALRTAPPTGSGTNSAAAGASGPAAASAPALAPNEFRVVYAPGGAHEAVKRGRHRRYRVQRRGRLLCTRGRLHARRRSLHEGELDRDNISLSAPARLLLLMLPAAPSPVRRRQWR